MDIKTNLEHSTRIATDVRPSERIMARLEMRDVFSGHGEKE